MLVLSAKVDGERIIIGHDGEITIRVLDVNGDRVRLGIEAPPRVPINRESVLVSKQGSREKEPA